MKLTSILSVILLIQTRFLSTTGKDCEEYCAEATETNSDGNPVHKCGWRDDSCSLECSSCSISEEERFRCIRSPENGYVIRIIICLEKGSGGGGGGSGGTTEGGGKEDGGTYEVRKSKNKPEGGLGAGIIVLIIVVLIIGTCALTGAAFMHAKNSRS